MYTSMGQIYQENEAISRAQTMVAAWSWLAIRF